MADDVTNEINDGLRELDQARQRNPGAGLLLYQDGHGVVEGFVYPPVAIGIIRLGGGREENQPKIEAPSVPGRIR